MNNVLIKSKSSYVLAQEGMLVDTDDFSGAFKKARIIEVHDSDNSVTITTGLPIGHRVWARNCKVPE